MKIKVNIFLLAFQVPTGIKEPTEILSNNVFSQVKECTPFSAYADALTSIVQVILYSGKRRTVVIHKGISFNTQVKFSCKFVFSRLSTDAENAIFGERKRKGDPYFLLAKAVSPSKSDTSTLKTVVMAWVSRLILLFPNQNSFVTSLNPPL